MSFINIDHAKATAYQRFEAKYFLSEVQAEAVRDYIIPYVHLDPYTVEGQEYGLSSLYLDSPGLALCKSSEYGEKNRFKLRIRGYDNDQETVFFEVKSRINQVIKKKRAWVHQSCVERLLHGEGYTMDALVNPSERGMDALLTFRNLMERFRCTPRCNVRYHREAWMSALDEPVRISFDRNLCCVPTLTYSPACWAVDQDWRPVHQFDVVMEIKFTDAFPHWVRRLIQFFELERISCAKYVLCVHQLHKTGFDLTGYPLGV